MHIFSQTSPDLPNQIYAELIHARAEERLARRIRRQKRADRRAARHSAAQRPDVRPTVTEQVDLHCSPQQA